MPRLQQLCVLWTHTSNFASEDVVFNLAAFASLGLTPGELVQIVPLSSEFPPGNGSGNQQDQSDPSFASSSDGGGAGETHHHHPASSDRFLTVGDTENINDVLTFDENGHPLPFSTALKPASHRSQGLLFIVPPTPHPARAHTGLKLSLSSSIAQSSGLRRGMHVLISRASKRTHTASHVEIAFRDQYLSRGDMWRIVHASLADKVVYQGEEIVCFGTVRARVKGVFVNGMNRRSAYVRLPQTEVVFRSEAGRCMILIQMSKEMWNFEADGSGEIIFDKVVGGFLPDLFKRWGVIDAHHLVSVILFARLEYDDVVLDEPPIDGKAREKFKDFYRIVVSDASSSDWVNILSLLKREFGCFLRDISVLPTDFSSPSATSPMISGAPTSSMCGNVLEAIHLSSSHFTRDHIDRDLVRTGNSVVLITPGCGVFEVDYEMLKLANDLLVRVGVCVELVCLGAVPLHAVPLFRYRYPIVVEDRAGAHTQIHAQHNDGDSSGPNGRHYLHSDSPPFCAAELAALPQSLRRERLRASVSYSKSGWADINGTVESKHTPGEWRYAVPDWMRVSYWRKEGLMDIGFEGKARTPGKLSGFGNQTGTIPAAELTAPTSELGSGPGSAAARTQISLSMAITASRREAHQARVWLPRCNMYELQMMGMMENEQTGLKVEGLFSDTRFPRSIFPPEKGSSQDESSEVFPSVEAKIEMMSRYMDEYDDNLWLYPLSNKGQSCVEDNQLNKKSSPDSLGPALTPTSAHTFGNRSRLSVHRNSGSSGRRSVEIFGPDVSQKLVSGSPSKPTDKLFASSRKSGSNSLTSISPSGAGTDCKTPRSPESSNGQAIPAKTKPGQASDSAQDSPLSSTAGSIFPSRKKLFWADPAWFAKQLRSSLSRTSAQFLSGKITEPNSKNDSAPGRTPEASHDSQNNSDTDSQSRSNQKIAHPISIPNSQSTSATAIPVPGDPTASSTSSIPTAPTSSSATPRPKRVAFENNADGDVEESSSVGTIRGVEIESAVVLGSGGSGSGGSGNGSLIGAAILNGASGLRQSGSASSMERMAVYRQKGSLTSSRQQNTSPYFPTGQGQSNVYGNFVPRHHYSRRFRPGPPSDPISKVLSPTAAISPWLIHLDPCNPSIPRMPSSTGYAPASLPSMSGKWKHMQNKYPFMTAGSVVNPPLSVVRWKSLCVPAIPPLTAPPLPPPAVLAAEYEDSVYMTAVRNSRMQDSLLREMIVARLSQGFRIVEGSHTHALLPPAQTTVSRHPNAAQVEGSGGIGMDAGVNVDLVGVPLSQRAAVSEVVLAIGNTVHYLRPLNGSVEVKRLNRKPMIGIRRNNPSGDVLLPSSSDTFSLPYKAYIFPPLSASYVEHHMQLTLPQRGYNWNFIDRFLAGHHATWSPQLPYWRARFVLIPAPVKRTSAYEIDTFKGLSDEEVRIEGIEKVSRAWERGRHWDDGLGRQRPGLHGQQTEIGAYQGLGNNFGHPKGSRNSFRHQPASTLGQSYTRSRHKNVYHSRAPGDSNPLRIHFQTHNPSTLAALTAANSGALPDIFPLTGQDGHISDADVDETSLDGGDSVDRWSDDEGGVSTSGSTSAIGPGANTGTTNVSNTGGGSMSKGKPAVPSRFRHSIHGLDLARLAADLQSEGGLSMIDRPWHWTLHRRSFLGTDLTNWLLQNVAGLTDRHAAVRLGNELMHKGLFEHVKTQHPFRDGNFFYRIAERYRKKWWGGDSSGLKSGQMSRQTPYSQGNYYATAAKVAATASADRIVLSRTIRFDVDPRHRSDRPEVLTLHYGTTHNPDNCYHFRLDWLNVTAKLIEDHLSNWTSMLEPYGLKVVEVPVAEAVSICDYHPFRLPYPVNLAVKPPTIKRLHLGKNGKTDIVDPHAYYKAFLQRLGFVLDTESMSSYTRALASSSTPGFKVEYSYGKPDYKYTQYIHSSGLLLVQIVAKVEGFEDDVEGGANWDNRSIYKTYENADFVLLANRLCHNRAMGHGGHGALANAGASGSAAAAAAAATSSGTGNHHAPGHTSGTPSFASRPSLSVTKQRPSSITTASSVRGHSGTVLNDLAQLRKGVFSSPNITSGTSSVGSISASGSVTGPLPAHASHFAPSQLPHSNSSSRQHSAVHLPSSALQQQLPVSSGASAASISVGSESPFPSRAGSIVAASGGGASNIPPFSFIPSDPASANVSVVSGSTSASVPPSAPNSALASLVSSASASVTNLALSASGQDGQRHNRIPSSGQDRGQVGGPRGGIDERELELAFRLDGRRNKAGSREKSIGGTMISTTPGEKNNTDLSRRNQGLHHPLDGVEGSNSNVSNTPSNGSQQDLISLTGSTSTPNQLPPGNPAGITTLFYTPLGETVERSMSAASVASMELDISLAGLDLDSSELRQPTTQSDGEIELLAEERGKTGAGSRDGEKASSLNAPGDSGSLVPPTPREPPFNGTTSHENGGANQCLHQPRQSDHADSDSHHHNPSKPLPLSSTTTSISTSGPPSPTNDFPSDAPPPPVVESCTFPGDYTHDDTNHPPHPLRTTTALPPTNPLMFALQFATMNEPLSAEILKNEFEKLANDKEWLTLVWEEEQRRRERVRRRG